MVFLLRDTQDRAFDESQDLLSGASEKNAAHVRTVSPTSHDNHVGSISERHLVDLNVRDAFTDDLFNIIIQLQPTQSGIVLKLLKDHDAEVKPEASVKLDPNTFLVMSE